MACAEAQASLEARQESLQKSTDWGRVKRGLRLPEQASETARVFKIISLADGMFPAFVSDTPERDTRMKEINSMR